MSVEVGTAYVSVIPSAKGFSRSLQSQIGGGMSAAGRAGGDQYASAMGASLKSKATTILSVFAGGAGVLGGLAAAGAAFGVKTAAANEQAQISFTTMLGSAQKARSFLGEMQKFAASTPFEFPELQTAASSLISAGINADKVIPIMRTLGDVTSGMGTGSEGVRRATIALQQMSAAGRITGEDLNQLRDAGIPVYDLLSKATGKSKAEVVKLAQAGKLGTKELGQMMKALETGKGLERFSGLMDKQSASLTGMWSTFKDTLGQGLANALAPSIPLLKDGLGKASEALAKVLPKVGEALKNAITYGVQFAKDFKNGAGTAGKFRDVLERVGNIVSSVTGFIRDHSTAVQVLLSALGGGLVAFKAITTAVKIYTGVQALLNVVLSANPISLVIIAVAALAAGVIVAYKKSETFRNIVKGAFDAIGKAARFMWNNVVAPVIRFLLKAFASVADYYAALLRGMSKIPGFGWAKGAADKLQGVANKARNIANNIRDIPAQKTVNVDIYARTRQTGRITLPDGSKVNVGMRAHGGPVKAGQPYVVGERRPELFVPSESGRIEPRVSGGGGLSQADINRLAAAMSQVQLKATVSATSFDSAMAVGL